MRAVRAVRAVAAALFLLLVLAVLPAVLVVVQSAVVWDWPVLLAQPWSALGAFAAAIGIGWAVWLALVWQVLRDLVAAIRGRRRTASLPVPLSMMITAAASGIVLALDAARGGGSLPMPDGPAPDTAAVDTTWQPSPAHQPSTTVERADAGVQLAAGVQLPGGWLPLPVAGAVATAAALAWSQARRRYTPRPPGGWRRDDPDLPIPTASLRRLMQLTTPIPDGSLEPDDASHGLASQPDPAVADGPMLVDLLPAGELHLVGPGRHDAARGLLVALSAAGSRPRLHLTPAFVAAALQPTTRAPSGGPVVLQPGDPPRPDTVTVLFTTDRAPGGAAVPGPDPAAMSAARCTIRVAATPGGPACWHIHADGTVRVLRGPATSPGRLPILDRRTARDLLAGLGVLPAGESPRTAAPGRAEDPGAEPVTLTGWPDPPPDAAGVPRRLQLQVFGAVSVRRPHPDGSHSPIPIRRTAAQQILVLLAIHRGGLTDDELKEALWPDVPRSAAQRRYLTTMSELRRALQVAAGRPVLRTDGPAATQDTPRRHRLDPAAVQVDLWRLRGLLDTAATTTDPRYRRLLLLEATTVASGELAAGWSYAWLQIDREQVIRHLLDVHTHLADLEPDHHTAVRLLQQALRLAPTNEHLHRRALQRLAAGDDPDGLRRTAATLSEHLTAYGLQPEPQTVTLLTMLFGDPTTQVAGDPTAAVGRPREADGGRPPTAGR